jgi:hypothetical protein
VAYRERQGDSEMTELPNKELLDRWCLIATELNVSERTAMRYHMHHGLPVSYDPAGHPVTTKTLLAAWKTKNLPKNITEEAIT